MVRRVSLPRRSPRWLELPMRIGTRAEARQESLSTRRSGWRGACTRTLLNEPMTPEELVREFTARQPYELDDFQLDAIRALANRHSVLVAAPTGTGKALASNTRVLTPQRWKPIGDLRPGDQVIGSDGQPTKVLGVFPQGVRQGYRVSFSDGTSVICDLEHLWAVNTKSRRH